MTPDTPSLPERPAVDLSPEALLRLADELDACRAETQVEVPDYQEVSRDMAMDAQDMSLAGTSIEWGSHVELVETDAPARAANVLRALAAARGASRAGDVDEEETHDQFVERVFDMLARQCGVDPNDGDLDTGDYAECIVNAVACRVNRIIEDRAPAERPDAMTAAVARAPSEDTARLDWIVAQMLGGDTARMWRPNTTGLPSRVTFTVGHHSGDNNSARAAIDAARSSSRPDEGGAA